MLQRFIFVCSLVLGFVSAFAAGDQNERSEKIDTIVDGRPVRFEPIKTDSLPFLGAVKVSGNARMFAVYRDMDESYADMVTANKNLEFTDYPTSGGGSANGSGQPFIELNLGANPSRNFDVGVGYAMFHTFNGLPDSASKTIVVRSLLNFTAKLATDYGLFKMRAGGGVLWTALSPLTLSNPEYRPNNFDRLPWDWYHSSMKKYNDFFGAKANLGGESYGNIAMQGVQFSGDGLPMNFGFIGMYGRTNFSVDQALAGFFPSQLIAGRLYNTIGSTVIGANYYGQRAYISTKSNLVDNHEIITGDATINLDGIKIFTELGAGRVQTPNQQDQSWGLGGILRFNLPESKSLIPLNIQLFNISHNVVSNTGSALNSNINAPGNGHNANPQYTTTVFVNPLQENGQLANNRRGTSVSTGKSIGDNFHIEFSLAWSQEIKNIYDTITFQHRTNPYSRSRFNPWLQDAGPYRRIKNIFRRSYEYISITDKENGVSTDYLKTFSSIDFSLNYRTKVLGKQFIAKYYTNYGSIQPGGFMSFGDEAFLRQFYNQIIGFMEVTKKVSLVAMYETERNIANNRTTLSNYNRKALDQKGYGLGLGLDYDFSEFAGVYLRHRWMHHDDINFVKDRFTGTETTVELKVFF